MCDSHQLMMLEEMKVIKPEGITQEHVQRNQATYSEEERWIFFEKIWTGPIPAVFTMMLCHACGFIFTNPRFTDEEIHVLYQTINELQLPKVRRAHRPFDKVEQRARRIYSLVSKRQKYAKPPQRILDFGGMCGQNLVPFAQADYDCCLLDYVKVGIPSGVKYLGRDICDMQANERFDVIMVLHVMEHTIRPLDVMKKLVPFLAEGGLLYMEVPNGCIGEWRGFDEPTTLLISFPRNLSLN